MRNENYKFGSYTTIHGGSGIKASGYMTN